MVNALEMNLSGSDNDEIYRIKSFIAELALVQDNYFQNLFKNLKLDGNIEHWLFDYIFNNISDLTFEEYLDKFNIETL